jgi:hypothetical protein
MELEEPKWIPKFIELQKENEKLKEIIYEVGVFLGVAKSAAATGNYAPIDLAIDRLRKVTTK